MKMFRWGMGIKIGIFDKRSIVLIARIYLEYNSPWVDNGHNTVHNLPWVGIILDLVMGWDGWHCTKDQGVGGDCLRQHWSKTAGLSFFKSRMILIMMKTMMALVYKQ